MLLAAQLTVQNNIAANALAGIRSEKRSRRGLLEFGVEDLDRIYPNYEEQQRDLRFTSSQVLILKDILKVIRSGDLCLYCEAQGKGSEGQGVVPGRSLKGHL